MRYRKLLSCVLAAGFVLGTGCGKKKEKKEVVPVSFSQYYSTETSVFKGESFVNGVILDEYICGQTYEESEEYTEARREWERVHFAGEEGSPVDKEGNPIQPENILKFFDFDGKEVFSYDMNEEFGRSLNYRSFCVAEDGFWALSVNIDDIGNQTLRADKVDPKKGSVENVKINLDATDEIIRSFYVDEDGRFCIIHHTLYEKLVLSVFNKKGDLSMEVELPCDYFTNIAEWNGKLTLVENRMDNQENSLYCLNEKEQKWEEQERKVALADRLLVRDGNVFASSWKMLTCIGEEKNEDLIWTNVSVFGHPDDVKLGKDGEILVLSSMVTNDMLVLYRLKPSEKDPATDKKEIVIAGTRLNMTILPTLVEELSILHPDVKYVLRDYCDEFEMPEDEEGDYWSPSREEVYEKMSLDLVSGNAPDVYFDDYNSLDLDELARLGYLTDLSSYTEKLDTDKYFVDKMTKGEKTPYVISTAFNVMGFEASAKYVKNPDVWSFDDFYESAEAYSDLQSIQCIYSKESLLEDVLRADMDRFTVNGEVNLNSGEYIQLLKWAKEVGHNSDWDTAGEIDLDNGVYMLNWGGLGSLTDIIQMKDHIVVGWPGENGSLHSAPRNLFAVSSTCKNPDLAWEIIEYEVGDDFQTRYKEMITDISVNKTVFRTDCDEGFELMNKYQPDEVTRTKEEYIAEFEKLIARADHYETGSRVIVDICLDEAAEYLRGDYTAEHVAELTQNRVWTFVKESS